MKKHSNHCFLVPECEYEQDLALRSHVYQAVTNEMEESQMPDMFQNQLYFDMLADKVAIAAKESGRKRTPTKEERYAAKELLRDFQIYVAMKDIPAFDTIAELDRWVSAQILWSEM